MKLETCLLSASYGHIMGVLALLFLTSVLYAILLEWSERRFGFVSAYTWLTVVVGVAYTLGILALLSWQASVLALVMFAVSGVPIVGRSIINDMVQRNERMDYHERRGNGD